MSVHLPSDDFLIDLVDKYKLLFVPTSDNIDRVSRDIDMNNNFIPVDRNIIASIIVKHNIIKNFNSDDRAIVEKYFLLLFEHFHSMEIYTEVDRLTSNNVNPPFLTDYDRPYFNLLINKNNFFIASYGVSTLWHFIHVLLKIIEYHTTLNSVIELNEKDNKSNDNNLSSSSSKFINLPKKKKHMRKI